jgi:sigma-54 dependent transcriptional regulator of gfr operon
VLYIYDNTESLILNKELTEAIDELGNRYYKELKIAKVILDELEKEVSIPNKKIFMLYLFMFVYSQQRTLKKRNINAIIIAHGYSTAIALDVGQRILNDESIESIADNSVKKIYINSRVIQKKLKKKAIVTTCTTRLGAAKMIKKLIDENTENKIPIFTIDYYELKDKGINQSVLQDYSVEMIIGTEDPEVKDIPFISFETFINRKLSDSLLKKAFPDIFNDKILDSINEDMVKMFTLENIVDYLTILNPRQTINQVEDAVVKIERSFGVKMDGFLKISLYIHISCMMERVIIKNPNLNYPELDNFVQYHVHFIKVVKNAFSVIEQYYNVEIPFSEIGFIYDIMKNRIEISNS